MSFSRKRFEKTSVDKVMKYIMIGAAALYCILILTALIMSDGSWELLGVVITAAVTIPGLIALLVIIGFIRYILLRRETDANKDKYLASFTAITAFITALITLLLTLALFITSAMDIEFPYNSAYISSHLIKMILAFGALIIVTAVLGLIFQWIIGKIKPRTAAER